MELTLFRFLNGLTGQGWDSLITFCATNLQYIVGGVFIVATLWPLRRIRMLIISLTAAVIARFGVKSAILLFVERARPFATLTDVRNIIGVDVGENLQSFPSGHAIFFFALATAAHSFSPRIGRWLFVGAILISISRVIGGVHWPSDILVGALLGILIGWAVAKLSRQFI